LSLLGVIIWRAFVLQVIVFT